ncbi:hypothetical protein [Serratia marcescens]|uniref:hypothetical protein n=1 Tax=Serratia marcescens TaxID=615 RepID=UPI00404622DA
MSRKNKYPVKKNMHQNDSKFSKFEEALFLHVSKSMKEVRSATLERTRGAEELVNALTNDLLFEINQLSDELDLTDFNIIDEYTGEECIELASSALTVAIYALCLTKELKAIASGCSTSRQAKDESPSSVINSRLETISRKEALDRLMVAASRPGATIEFFSSDDPLPN